MILINVWGRYSNTKIIQTKWWIWTTNELNPELNQFTWEGLIHLQCTLNFISDIPLLLHLGKVNSHSPTWLKTKKQSNNCCLLLQLCSSFRCAKREILSVMSYLQDINLSFFASNSTVGGRRWRSRMRPLVLSRRCSQTIGTACRLAWISLFLEPYNMQIYSFHITVISNKHVINLNNE